MYENVIDPFMEGERFRLSADNHVRGENGKEED